MRILTDKFQLASSKYKKASPTSSIPVQAWWIEYLDEIQSFKGKTK